MIEQNTRIKISSEVLFQELENEAVLLNIASEQYHGLNDNGTRIWQLLAQHGNVEQVVAQMLAEYVVPEEILRHDVKNFIEEMAEAGLVAVA